jgi:hypothetical protein
MPLTYRVVVRCPATDKLLETGIVTSGREALSNNIQRGGKIFCRHCGRVHEFEDNAALQPDRDGALTELWRPNMQACE